MTVQSPVGNEPDPDPADPDLGMSRLRKILRRVLGLAARVFAGGCVLGLLLLGLLQFDGTSTWLVRGLAERFNPYPGTQLTVDRVSGSWIRSLRVVGLRLTPLQGREPGGPEVLLDSLEVRFRLLPLLVRRLEIRGAEVRGLRADLTQRPDSLWDFLLPFQAQGKPDAPEEGESRFRLRSGPIRVRDSAVRVTFAPGSPSVEPDRLDVEELSFGLANLELGAGRLLVGLDTLHLRFLPPGESLDRVVVEGKCDLNDRRVVVPGLTLRSGSSDFSAEGTLLLPQGGDGEVEGIDFRLRATPLAFRDLSGFVRTLDPTVSAQADISLRGQASLVEVSGGVTLSDGGSLELDGALTPSLSGPVEYRFEATAAGLRLENFLGEGPVGGVVDGQVATGLQGNDLSHLQGDLSARLEGLRFKGRGIRPLAVSGGFVDGQANLEMEAGAEGLGSVQLSVGGRPLDSEPTLLVQGAFRQSAPLTAADSNPLAQAGIQELESHFSLETRGFSPDSAVAELEMETLRGSFKGLSLEGGRLTGSWNGGRATFELGQPLGTGRVATTGEVGWADGGESGGGSAGRVLSYSLPDLQLRDVDLFRLLGDTVPSRVNAEVSLNGMGTDPGTLDAEVLVRVGESEFLGIAVDSAVIRPRLTAGDLSVALEGWMAGSGMGSSIPPEVVEPEGEPGGRVVASLQGRPFDAQPFLVLDSLQLSGIDLASIAGVPSRINGLARARMEGFDPRTGHISAELSLSPSLIRDTPVDSAEVVLSLSEGDLRLSGHLSSTDGSIGLSGSASPFQEPLQFRLDQGEVRGFDLGSVFGKRGLESSLNLDLTLSGSGASIRELEAVGTLEVLPSTVNQGDIEGGTIALEASGGQETLDGRVRAGGGEVTLKAVATTAEEIDDFRVESDVNLPDLGGLLGRPEAVVSAEGNVVVTRTSGTPLAFATELQGRIGEAAVDTLTLSGTLGESVLRLDTLRLRSEILQADGGGRMALKEDPDETEGSDLTISASTLDLSPLGPLLGLPELTAQSGRGEFHVTGPGGSPSLETSLEIGRWRAGRLSGDTARVRANFDPDEVTLAMWLQAPQGRGSIDLALRADPRPEAAQGILERLDISAPETAWTLDAEVPFSWKDGLRIDGFLLQSLGEGRISVDGSIDPGGDQDLTLRLEEASLSGVAKFLGLESLNLLADGRMHLTGPAASPAAEGELSLALAVSGDVASSIDARFSLAGGKLIMDAQATDSAGGVLTLDGTVPFAFSLAPKGDTAPSAAGDAPVSPAPATGPVDFTLQSEAFDISWARALFPQGTVAALGGVLSADAKATGPADQLDLEGRIGLRDGLIRLPASGTRYQGINLSAELRNDEIQIAGASVSSGSGSAQIRGSLALRGFRIEETDLSAQLDRFLAWNTPSVSATLTGNVSLRGPIQEPRLAGTLNLEGSKLGLDDFSSGNELAAVELTDEDYRMLEDYFGYRAQRTEVEPSNLVERFGLDLSLGFDRDVWVNRSRQPRLSLEIRGELEIRKEPHGELQAIGTIETLPGRGYFREFGRRFSVQEGELTLTGNPSEFSFRMDAQWEVPSYSNPDEAEVVVNLEVAGRAESMELTLSSDPEMDEADIVSYLATGKPQSALASSGADESAMDIPGLGASMAAGALAGALEGYASGAVNLDVVEIKVDPVRGTILIAGRYVSPNLYLGFRQPVTFSESTKKTRTENQTSEVELDYRWFRWLTVNVQGGASGEIRLFLKARYAY